MSNTQVNDGRSIDLIRKLLERKLVDRAVLLGEGRWPGSGPFIQLAAEWQNLTPDQRATRLREIGPEGLERARALSDVHPEIGRVIDTLEAQGVLTQRDEALNVAAEDAVTSAEEPPISATIAADESAMEAVGASVDAEEGSDGSSEALSPLLPVVVEPAAIEDLPLERTEPLRPVLDEEAIAAAEAILERVHQRVQQTIDHADAMPMPAPEPEIVLQSEVRRRDEPLPMIGLTAGVPRARLASLRQATAAEHVSYTELDTAELSRQELFGSLERSERGVETVAGALPKAVSRPGVVVVIGHLLPTLVKRLQDGYCDIPGTRSTVRVHPESRIVLIEGR